MIVLIVVAAAIVIGAVRDDRPAPAREPGGRRARAVADVRLRWLAGKALAALLTLAFVLVFNFFLFRVMGDPTAQLARLPRATPQEIQQLRHYYGLDKPLLGQFADYVGDTLRATSGSASARAAPSPPSSATRSRGRCCSSVSGRCSPRCWGRGWG